MDIMHQQSDFIAQMTEVAKGLPQPDDEKPDISRLENDELWRRAWLKPDTFSDSRKTIAIEDPQTLLINLDKEGRKSALISYLEGRFPLLIKNTWPTDFGTISGAAPDDLALLGNQKIIRNFLLVGKVMQNEQIDAVRDIPGSSFGAGDIGNIESLAKEELKGLYKDRVHAFNDFLYMMRTHPNISTAVSSDPAKLKLATNADGTMFAAAVRLEVFSARELKKMTKKYQEWKVEQAKVVSSAVEGRSGIMGGIEEKEQRNFVEKVKENFSGLETWQKLAVIAIGAYYVHRTMTKGMRITRWLGVCLPAFYLSGARNMLEGTVIGDGLTQIEGVVSKGIKSIRENPLVGVTPDLSDGDLRAYAQFMKEVATEDLNEEEIEAMGYISEFSLGVIADSFVLENGARTGRLDVYNRKSAISREIKDLYSSTGQDYKVRSRLSAYESGISDSLAHVFYVLGAMENPVSHREVEKARKGAPYDSLPDGSDARQTYELLAHNGMELAKDKYAGMSFYQVIEKILDRRISEVTGAPLPGVTGSPTTAPTPGTPTTPPSTPPTTGTPTTPPATPPTTGTPTTPPTIGTPTTPPSSAPPTVPPPSGPVI